MSGPCLALSTAVARLRSPVAEEWSALTGVPALAIAVGPDDPVPAADALAAAAARLVTLACPSIVWVIDEPPPVLRPLLAACDVVVGTRPELEALVAAVAATPIAAATLAQVLRAGDGRTIADGLVVESLAYATLQAGPEHARWLAARGPAPRPPVVPAKAVDLTRRADALHVTLQRPERHNAFSARMRDELCEALALASADPLAVVLRGAGPSFCSGGDLDEFGTRSDPATAHLLRMTRSPARLLADLAVRVRAEVHGACIGAGVELAAFASRVIATPDAFFQLPEIGMGLIPGAGGTVSLPRRIGRQRTAYLALSGCRLDAATARAWGLIDALVDRHAALPTDLPTDRP